MVTVTKAGKTREKLWRYERVGRLYFYNVSFDRALLLPVPGVQQKANSPPSDVSSGKPSTTLRHLLTQSFN